MSFSFDPLLISIAAPLALALAIGLGLPKRWSVRLAYAGFGHFCNPFGR
jgi:NADH-quinone oxidoreductase subunit M